MPPFLFWLPVCLERIDIAPTFYANQSNTKIIAKSKDQVWDSFIPALSSKFFVINNIDKASGLINVSYSGDPEKYVDCGQQHSSVKNARGERTYDLPLSRQHLQYEILDNKKNILIVDRTNSLEGRINIIVSTVDEAHTSITVNTKYIFTVESRVGAVAVPQAVTFHSAIDFNTGGSATTQGGTNCRATGVLEQEILSLAT